MSERMASMPVGVVIRRSPGATRWARWTWRAVAVLPGAGPADWKELRRDGEAVEYHAATVPLELHRAETEGYLVSLNMARPTVFVVLRPNEDPASPHEWSVHGVFASAFEAQDYQDSGEETVEPVPMPEGLAAWVSGFCARHHVEERFRKRRRDRREIGEAQDGIGDARVRQAADIYRAPGSLKPGRAR